MTDAVIVSTARTGLAKSWKGAFNMTHGATLGGHVVQGRRRARRRRPGRGRRRDDGLRQPRGRHRRQHRAPDRAARRAAGDRRRRHRQPLLLVGPADDRDGRAAHHRRRGRRSIVAGGVETISCVQNEINRHMLRGPGWLESTSPRSTGPCCRPPRRWPSATTSRKRAQDEYGVRSQQRAAPRRRPASSTTRSCRSP